MQVPLQLTYRHVEPSPAITDYVEKKAAKLGTFNDRITACRVAVEAPHRSQAHGNHYRVRVDIHIPGHEIVVGDHNNDVQHEDLYAAVDAVFDDAARRLREYARIARREVKQHAGEASSVRAMGEVGAIDDLTGVTDVGDVADRGDASPAAGDPPRAGS